MGGWSDVHREARRQRGIVAVRQAYTNVPEATVRRRAREERWVRVARGVVALPGAQIDLRAALIGVTLAVGDPVAVTGWTAAWLHGLTRNPPAVIEVTVPHERRATELTGLEGRPIKSYRSRNLPPHHVLAVDGIPCVTPARLLFDLARTVKTAQLRPLMIDVLERRMATPDAIKRCGRVLRNAKGTAIVRRLLGELVGEECDAIHEWHWRRAFVKHGLAPDSRQPRVAVGGQRPIRVDIGWSRYRVGVECVGLRYHNALDQRLIDHRRYNGLQNQDWRIFLVAWTDLDSRVDDIIRQVREALVARGWSE